ncbi:unnamed protein product [Rhizoctonia solani]|uniref:Thioredoxin-like protein AAED1 n=1 Tax=Rhizoctonia solani TaxID=456999 RepID=A0A8H3AYC5_9AGAM|nr:unnamed protein product [Rhizoctonia solani]
MLSDSQSTGDMELPLPPAKRHPYLNRNSSSTTFHTSVSSFTHFAPTFPSHSQSSLGHSIKARYPDPYSDNPFLPLKELRRLRSSEILRSEVAPSPLIAVGPVPVLDDEEEPSDGAMSLILSALADSQHTPTLTPDSTASDEDLPNVDFSPTSSTGARPYTSYFARNGRSRSHSIDSEDDGLYTPAVYKTAVSSDILQALDKPEDGDTGEPTRATELDGDEYGDAEKNFPEPILSLQTQPDKAPNPCTPPRKRPPPIRVGNQGPRSAATQIVTASPNVQPTSSGINVLKTPASLRTSESFITVPEEEEDDVVGSPLRRSLKLSGASAFSLSLFPPTPTTPMNRQSWVRNGRTSMEGSSFSPGQRSMGTPVAFSTPRQHPYRSVPPTPTRRSHRATMEIDRPRHSVLFGPGRASVDAPRFTQAPKPQPTASRPSADTTSDSSYSQTTDSASFYSDAGPSNVSALVSAIEESRRRASYMRSDSAFETCLESASRTSKDILSQSRLGSCEDVLSTRVLPPARKPVPRISAELIEMTAPKSRMSLPDPVTTSSSPTPTSALSINSVPAGPKPKAKKKKKTRKLVISHPHMSDEHSPSTPSETTLPIGPKVTYSNSIGSLRDELLGNVRSLKVPAKAKKSKKGKKQPPLFDRHSLLNEDQLRLASDMNVYDENSRPVRFGDIFKDQKTAICFIRHFWCPLCQDYMSSIVHLTEPSLLQKAGVKLVIIGNGSPSMIKSYKNDVFHCPYEMYTDPDRKVYNALGMTLRTNDGGSEHEKGSYVKHGTFTGTMLVLKRALKMPLASSGDIKQLGGEFVLGPGLNCSFASRMHTTRSHTPIRDLLQAAGVSMNPSATELSILSSSTDSARWMDAQNEDLNNMIRKGLRASCGGDNCLLDTRVEDEKVDLREFRRLIERLKDQGSEPEPDSERPRTTYLMEVTGQSRTELDQLGAAAETRGGR